MHQTERGLPLALYDQRLAFPRRHERGGQGLHFLLVLFAIRHDSEVERSLPAAIGNSVNHVDLWFLVFDVENLSPLPVLEFLELPYPR